MEEGQAELIRLGEFSYLDVNDEMQRRITLFILNFRLRILIG